MPTSDVAQNVRWMDYCDITNEECKQTQRSNSWNNKAYVGANGCVSVDVNAYWQYKKIGGM